MAFFYTLLQETKLVLENFNRQGIETVDVEIGHIVPEYNNFLDNALGRLNTIIPEQQISSGLVPDLVDRCIEAGNSL